MFGGEMGEKSAEDRAVVQHINARLDAEIADFTPQTRSDHANLAAFCKARVAPRLVTVNFSGGLTQKCWNITRSNGTYRVVYLPSAGYFSLCVESDFGPLDIGVHGGAINCFSSV